MNASLARQEQNGTAAVHKYSGERNKKAALRIKSYYARSVEEAIGKASEELGSDAILVHSRKTPIESRHLGPYEVVFALSAKAEESSKAAVPEKQQPSTPSLREPPPPAAKTPEIPLSVELMQMRRQMEEIRRALALRSMPVEETPEPDSPVQAARLRLVAAGVDEDLALAVVQACASELRAVSPDNPEPAVCSILKREMEKRLPLSPRGKTDQPAISVLFGPPGAGKTTTLVKLALAWGQCSPRPIHLISTDTYRIGAAEQLRTFASILGASLDVVDTPLLLSQAIEANRQGKTILIDTPGLSGSDFELLDGMADFSRRRNDIEKYLVLPATARTADMKRVIRQYERFAADRLIFTHADGTGTFGGLYSLSVWSAMPVAYLCAGQQIPEDLEASTASRIADLVLGAGERSGE